MARLSHTVLLACIGCATARPGWQIDEAQAVAWYEQACAPARASACGRAGLAYATGHGVPVDVARAAALLRAGCEAARESCLDLYRLTCAPEALTGARGFAGRAELEPPVDPGDVAVARTVAALAKLCDSGDREACRRRDWWLDPRIERSRCPEPFRLGR